MRTIEFPYKTYKQTPCPIISFKIQGPKGWRATEAYVDSGAFITILSIKDAERLAIDYRKGKEIYVTVGDGSLIPVHTHRLPIKIGDVKFPATIGFSQRLGVGFNLLGRKDIFSCFDVIFSDSRKKIIFRSVK